MSTLLQMTFVCSAVIRVDSTTVDSSVVKSTTSLYIVLQTIVHRVESAVGVSSVIDSTMCS